MDRADYKLVRDKTGVKCDECFFRVDSTTEDCTEPEEWNCVQDSNSLFYHWEKKNEIKLN
ncbi:MAG: hypothetical protein ABUK08_00415 [Candidatus Humimicrobiaceae bacterium]